MKKQLITPGGYVPTSVVNINVNGSDMTVEKSDGTTETQSLPSSGGSGSDTDIVEVTDTVTDIEGQADKHEIKATEGNGTINDVGSFVIAKQQVTPISTSYAAGGMALDQIYVDQDGNASGTAVQLSPYIDTNGITVTKSSSDSSPSTTTTAFELIVEVVGDDSVTYDTYIVFPFIQRAGGAYENAVYSYNGPIFAGSVYSHANLRVIMPIENEVSRHTKITVYGTIDGTYVSQVDSSVITFVLKFY